MRARVRPPARSFCMKCIMIERVRFIPRKEYGLNVRSKREKKEKSHGKMCAIKACDTHDRDVSFFFFIGNIASTEIKLDCHWICVCHLHQWQKWFRIRLLDSFLIFSIQKDAIDSRLFGNESLFMAPLSSTQIMIFDCLTFTCVLDSIWFNIRRFLLTHLFLYFDLVIFPHWFAPRCYIEWYQSKFCRLLTHY